MTRKPLPKAIVRSVEHLRDVGNTGKPYASAVDEDKPAQCRPSPPHSAEAPSFSRASGKFAAEDSPVSAIATDPQILRRRAEGKRIVERYKMYAAVGGLVPFAVVNIAGVTAITLRMIKALSDLYEVPFERDRTRSFVVGLMGGAVPTGLAAATASTLSIVTPVGGFVGLAISSIAASVFTRGIGLVFIDHFENETGLLATTASDQTPLAPQQ